MNPSNLRPLLPAQAAEDARERHGQLEPADTTPGRTQLKRRLRVTHVACNACRSKKSACDAKRPCCSACQVRNTACVYTSQDESETPTMALKRENRTLRARVAGLEGLFNHLRDTSEDDAQDILQRFRASPDMDSFLTSASSGTASGEKQSSGAPDASGSIDASGRSQGSFQTRDPAESPSLFHDDPQESCCVAAQCICIQNRMGQSDFAPRHGDQSLDRQIEGMDTSQMVTAMPVGVEMNQSFDVGRAATLPTFDPGAPDSSLQGMYGQSYVWQGQYPASGVDDNEHVFPSRLPQS